MGRRVKITLPTGETYRFDAIFGQEDTSRLSITSYPVQDGTPITDHAYKEPEDVSMIVNISDIKLPSYDDSFANVNSRAETAKAELKRWQNEVLLLTVQTKFEVFKNMILVGISTSIDKRNGNVLKSSLTFKRIRIATVEEIVAGPFENGNSASYESAYQNNGQVQGNEIVNEVIDIAGSTIGGVVAGAVVGAVIGGILGSIIPGAGTIAGAILGAKLGAIAGGSIGFLTKTWDKLF